MNRIAQDVANLMMDADHRVGLTRRPLFRIYEIHRALRTGTYPNCTNLAARLEVQRKTIQRDVTFMRDELGLPIVYDDSLHGYYYSEDVSDFPVFQTTVEELAGLFLARNALEAVRGTPLAETLRNAFAKLTRGMLGKVNFSWAELDEIFSRKVVEQNSRDIERLGKLAQGVMQQLVTTFSYRKLDADKATPRRVHPLHLGEVDGGWYLIAFDLERQALRTFALPRISRVALGKTRFERPAGFDGRSYLKRSFGIWCGNGDTRHLVRIELRGYAAQLVEERRYHPTQEIVRRNAKGNLIEVCFEVVSLEEILRWVLSFGRQAKVLGPPALEQMVREEIKAMTRN